MPSKLQFYAQMADQTAQQLTGSLQAWTGFLTTAGKDNLAALVKKYVKSGDYNKIKDSILAAKLLEDIKATFIKEE